MGVPCDDLSGLIAGDKAPIGGLMRIGSGFVAVLMSPPIDGMVSDKRGLADAHGGRDGQTGALGLSAVHELSHQKDGRRGCGGGRIPKVIIAPPQHGQRSRGRVVVGPSVVVTVGSTGGTSSSFR
jgi:hypothetical protein